MKTLSLILLALSACAAQAATKPCEALKAEIAAKLDEKGVKDYELVVVSSDKVGDAQVVGSCDGGANKITYSKK